MKMAFVGFAAGAAFFCFGLCGLIFSMVFDAEPLVTFVCGIPFVIATGIWTVSTAFMALSAMRNF